MAVHKLILDDVFEEVPYTLIAIHCTIEDYRLAYVLNKYLGVNLTRKPLDLDFYQGKSSFSIFQWEDLKQLTTWNLISNICKKDEYRQVKNASLFNTPERITKTFNLISEYKHVDYLLKIGNKFHFRKEKYIVNKMLCIPQISTAYSIDASQLKSKDNLIFN